jgi:hypothetical protein
MDILPSFNTWYRTQEPWHEHTETFRSLVKQGDADFRGHLLGQVQTTDNTCFMFRTLVLYVIIKMEDPRLGTKYIFFLVIPVGRYLFSNKNRYVFKRIGIYFGC